MTAFQTGATPDTSSWLDVLGPKVRVLTADRENDYAVLIGMIAPNVTVPLHSHGDRETFFVLAGSLEGYVTDQWHAVGEGGILDIIGNQKHAWRNTSGADAWVLMVTTNKMKRFFEEIGTVGAAVELPPPPEVLERVAEVAGSYGYWLAPPDANGAIGLKL